LKIKANDTVQLQTVSQIIEFLSSTEQLGVKEFKIDLIIDGKFTEVADNTIVTWKTNFLSIFVIDLVKSLQTAPLLSISGRAFDTMSEGIPIITGGEKVYIIMKEREMASLGTGLITWDGAVVLAKYLECHPSLVDKKSVLEVGAGTGLAGIAASLLGSSKTLLTDLDYALDNLKANVERNKKNEGTNSVEVSLLDWSDTSTYRFPSSGECLNTSKMDVGEHEWDVIIGADVVWLEELVPLLVQALAALCGPNVRICHT
jgi:hypothetical protein